MTMCYTAGPDADLCAVFDATTATLEDIPRSRRVPEDDFIIGDRFYVPLGIQGISHDDWQRLTPQITETIKAYLPTLRDGQITPFDVDLHTGCTERAAPVAAPADVLTTEYDEDRDFTLHVENPFRFGERVGTISPFTTDAQLAEIATAVRVLMAQNGEHIAELDEWLTVMRDRERRDCPDWGELSPYLEDLLERGHPAIRLKRAGKFNPEGRRVILIRVRHTLDDGGWAPAILDVCPEAEAQWHDAAIPFPHKLARKVAEQEVARLLRQARDQLSSGQNGGAEVSVLLKLAAQRDRLIAQLEGEQDTLRQALVAQCVGSLNPLIGCLRLSGVVDVSERGRLLCQGLVAIRNTLQHLALQPKVTLDAAALKGCDIIPQRTIEPEDMARARESIATLFRQLRTACEDDALDRLHYAFQTLLEVAATGE